MAVVVGQARTQLRLARPLAVDLRGPWEKAAEPNTLTPIRVRRGVLEPVDEGRLSGR
ncbi:hypothetical protein GCM10009579_04960 [Streptomyces javensis]|uniref:Uncharacterized protein n=1 Tax=Streptomyces javensis TaxID=114698 RepID=A0ABP4H6G1_9ACTN